MTVGELKELIKDLPDDMTVCIPTSLDDDEVVVVDPYESFIGEIEFKDRIEVCLILEPEPEENIDPFIGSINLN